jgi:MYXO-CTERM domain-containing protein
MRLLALVIALGLISGSVRAEPCGLPTDCPSGFCEDGVCCEAACPGPCMACSAALKAQGEDGTCGPAKAGTVCAPAGCSVAFTFDPADVCDGAGNCIDSGAGPSCIDDDPCTFDLCGDEGCEIAYKIDGTECDTGKVCIDNQCVAGEPGSGATGGSGGRPGTAASAGSDGAGGSGGFSRSDAGTPRGGSDAGGAAGAAPSEAEEAGCGCRASDGGFAGGALSAIALLVALGRRRRPR